MELYTVTARNAYFWQRLAVIAPNADAATEAFRAYLTRPAQQEYEAYEQEQSKMLVGENEPTERSLYIYKFDDEDIEEGDETEVRHRYSSQLDATVHMIGSGGNG